MGHSVATSVLRSPHASIVRGRHPFRALGLPRALLAFALWNTSPSVSTSQVTEQGAGKAITMADSGCCDESGRYASIIVGVPDGGFVECSWVAADSSSLYSALNLRMTPLCGSLGQLVGPQKDRAARPF